MVNRVQNFVKSCKNALELMRSGWSTETTNESSQKCHKNTSFNRPSKTNKPKTINTLGRSTKTIDETVPMQLKTKKIWWSARNYTPYN